MGWSMPSEFPGIWQEWTDKDKGEIVQSVAVTTAEANPLMQQIHNSKKGCPRS